MDTQNRSKQTSRFVILVPHRDSLKPLEAYRQKLFAAGFCGAYSFPLAAPLASVSRPLSREELKELARNVRDDLCGRKTAKIQSAETAFARCGPLSFLGIFLDFSVEEALFPRSAREKIIAMPDSPVLCAALADSGEKRVLEEAPVLSFRAASLANLALRPLSNGDPRCSFEWKIDPPVWLPKYRGKVLIP